MKATNAERDIIQAIWNDMGMKEPGALNNTPRSECLMLGILKGLRFMKSVDKKQAKLKKLMEYWDDFDCLDPDEWMKFKRELEEIQIETKKCSNCFKIKPVSEFYTRRDGHQSRCKDCNNEVCKGYQSEKKLREQDNEN